MKFESEGNNGLLTAYIPLLKKRVDKIFKRINDNFSITRWVVYDPMMLIQNKESKIQSQLKKFLVGISGEDYGFCRLLENNSCEIWISTLALQGAKEELFNNVANTFFKKELDLLSKVIIDELAHAKTRKDHNSIEYQKVHKKYYELCIGNYFPE